MSNTLDKKREPEDKKPPITPLQATVELARRGVTEVVPRLRKLLDEHPELVGHYDDLARRAQYAWLQLFGKDLLAQEGTARQLDALRQDLAESRASPLEKLVIQRIAACWLQTVYFDAREAVGQEVETGDMAAFRLKRQAQAHQQFLSAVIPMVREISQRYRPDGFWFDGDWQIPAVCYCGNCKAAWMQSTGREEPPQDTKDADWPRWAQLEQERLNAYKQKLADAIHQANGNCCYTSNWSWAISQRDPRTAPDFLPTR